MTPRRSRKERLLLNKASSRMRVLKQRRKPVRKRKQRQDEFPKPVDVCWSMAKWVKKTMHKTRIHRYYREHTDGGRYIFAQGKGMNISVSDEFPSGSVQFPPGFIMKMKGGRVWGKNASVISPDNRLLAEVSWDYDKELLHGRNHPAFKAWKSFPLTTFDGTVGVLAFVFSANYFHWLFDVLPRIHLIRQCGFYADRYIVNDDGLPFQDETLNMLGIPRQLRIETDNHFHLTARRLLVPAIPMTLGYPKWTYDFLREQFVIKRHVQKIDDHQRIYISRANSWQRKLLNEAEVQEILRSYGFNIVTLETLPVSEQIRIFASANVIVAAHGAGLANLAFCFPGTKVIELFSPNYVRKYYWTLSNQAGLDYYYLIADHFVQPSGTWEGAADFWVDAGKLRLLLQMADL